MTEDNKHSFAAKARRSAAQVGTAAILGMNAGCQTDEAPLPPFTPIETANPHFTSTSPSPEVTTGLRELARQVAEGKKFNTLIAKKTLQKALQDYACAHAQVQQEMRNGGFLHIHEVAAGQDKTAAVFINFAEKALVAAKNIGVPKDKDFPIYDLSAATRAGAVVEKDKAITIPEESGYLQMAYRFRDKNVNLVTSGIQKTIQQTGDIRKLSVAQFGVLNDDKDVMARFHVSDKLFPVVAIGRDVALKRFQGGDTRLGINIRWHDDERVYEAKRFNPDKEVWEPAGKANPFAAALASKGTAQNQER